MSCFSLTKRIKSVAGFFSSTIRNTYNWLSKYFLVLNLNSFHLIILYCWCAVHAGIFVLLKSMSHQRTTLLWLFLYIQHFCGQKAIRVYSIHIYEWCNLNCINCLIAFLLSFSSLCLNFIYFLFKFYGIEYKKRLD